MTAIVSELKMHVSNPLGIYLFANSPIGALAVAKCVWWNEVEIDRVRALADVVSKLRWP